MEIKRISERTLNEWKDRRGRAPLLVKGARQVGKSYMIREWAKRAYGEDSFIEINLEENSDLVEIFRGDLSPENICRKLEFITGINLLTSGALLFIDEIQVEPRAIMALRFFHEKAPQIPVIGAGSLLDFVMEEISFPVGRVESMYLHPISFYEFLVAYGKKNLIEGLRSIEFGEAIPSASHTELLDLLKVYFYVGGMPEALAGYLDSRNLVDASKVHAKLIEGYINDFNKYSKKSQWDVLNTVFEKIPTAIGVSRVKYSHFDKDIRSYKIKGAIKLLERARVISSIRFSSVTLLPISAGVDVDIFKLLFVDIGLLHYLIGIDWSLLPPNVELTNIAKGRLAEQFVGQEILANRSGERLYKLHYWTTHAGGDAEIDYIVEHKNKISPIEIKSGHKGTLKSLEVYKRKFKPETSFVLSQKNAKISNDISFLPLYMAGLL